MIGKASRVNEGAEEDKTSSRSVLCCLAIKKLLDFCTLSSNEAGAQA